MMSRRRDRHDLDATPGITYVLGAVVLAGLALFLYALGLAIARGIL